MSSCKMKPKPKNVLQFGDHPTCLFPKPPETINDSGLVYLGTFFNDLGQSGIMIIYFPFAEPLSESVCLHVVAFSSRLSYFQMGTFIGNCLSC